MDYEKFLNFICARYPWAKPTIDQHPPAAHLFSNTVIELPSGILQTLHDFIKTYYRITHSEAYVQKIVSMSPAIVELKPMSASVFTSFDFHITPDGPKLIEVNTNAAQASWAFLQREFQALPLFDFFADIKKMFEAELANYHPSDSTRVLIVDEHPEKQKNFNEFLFYQAMFQSWGWSCDIVDRQNVSAQNPVHLIYNRSTDFYFEEEASKSLKKIYEDQRVCVTPYPREYALMADKRRLVWMSSAQELEALGVSEDEKELCLKVIPQTRLIQDLPADAHKAERGQYFFKPVSGYGSRGTYDGHSISVKKFDEIYRLPYIAQELVPPPLHEGMKWDLRVLTYQDKIQLLWARLYRGQTTNAQTPGGGLAPVALI